ncbi:MAG: hypothetical protein ACJAU5_000548 [Maricaulis maris]|jgi:hypothetical protein
MVAGEGVDRVSVMIELQKPSTKPRDFTAYRIREYTALVEALVAARQRLASGPEILSLVNELVIVTEEILDFTDGCGEAGKARACCAEAEHFMAGLIEHAEAIRAANGAFGSRFIDFIQHMPIEAPRRAA